METLDPEAHRLRELGRVVSGAPQQEAEVLSTVALGEDRPERAQQSPHLAGDDGPRETWVRAEPVEQAPATIEVVAQRRIVQRAQDVLVTFGQPLGRHAGHEVGLEAVRVVAVRLPEQAALPTQSFVQLRPFERGEEADHRDRDSGVTDERDLTVEDVFGVLVEADDEAARDLDAVGLDAANGIQEIELDVDGLVRPAEALERRGLDPEKHEVEPGLAHPRHQLVVGAEVDRSLGEELERVAVVELPALERSQRPLGESTVADEVVVDEEDRPAPSGRDQGVQLRRHAVGRLDPMLAAVQLPDVAELAGERTAARMLHRHRGIGLEVEEVESRHRRVVEVGQALGAIRALGATALQVRGERGDRALGLSEEEVVHAGQARR